MQIIKTKLLRGGAILPTQADKGSNGFDLYYTGERGIVRLDPGDYQMLPTGISVEMPIGTFAFVTPRSGLATKGITIVNSPGLIDCVPSYEKIKTCDGTISVGDIADNPDVDIISYNTETHLQEIDRITDFWCVGEKEVLEIEFDDGSVVRCTETQLIQLKNGEWKKAIELTEEDEVLSLLNLDNSKRIKRVSSIGKDKVYDMTVARNSNFIVSGGTVLHNCSYRGEIKVILHNINNTKDPYYTDNGSVGEIEIHPNDRIAQLVFLQQEYCELMLVDELNETERGDKGFGSSGR